MKRRTFVSWAAGIAYALIGAFLFFGPKWKTPDAPAPVPDEKSEPSASARPPAIAAQPSRSQAAVDSIIEKMELGNIAFNAPRVMNYNDTALVHLVLGMETPIEELKLRIEAEGEKEGAQIRISDRMEARLSGSNFSITAVTPEVQAVTRADVTEWKWEVKPKSRGLQRLHLTLSVLFTVDGASTQRAIRTFDKEIAVEVTWSQKVGAFLRNRGNWQWIYAAILVPLTGWFWRRRKGPKSSPRS